MLPGEIKLMTGFAFALAKAEWEIVGTPWVINSGMLLRLQDMQTRRRQHLWVAADSMDARVARSAPAGVAKPAQE
jgi:toxin CptA